MEWSEWRIVTNGASEGGSGSGSGSNSGREGKRTKSPLERKRRRSLIGREPVWVNQPVGRRWDRGREGERARRARETRE